MGIRERVLEAISERLPDHFINVQAFKRSKKGTGVSQELILNARRKHIADLSQWEAAVSMATNPDNCNRRSLEDVYDSILVDAHLQSVMETRILEVVGSPYQVLDADGEQVEEVMEMMDAPWFHCLLEKVMEARFRGFTLLEITAIEEEMIKGLEMIPRRHVDPFKRLILKQEGDQKGWEYSTDRKLMPYIIEIGTARDLGLLENVAPLAIIKKYALGIWNEYQDKFGIPIRWVTTDDTSTKRQDQLFEMLSSASKAMGVVLNNGETMNALTAGQTDPYKVFDQFILRVNSEMSKRILGQDGTTDNKDSSGNYGSLQVLERVTEIRHKADKRYVASFINECVFPKLIQHGYPLEGLRFAWDEFREMEPEVMVDKVVALAPFFQFDTEELAIRTGLPIVGERITEAQSNETEPGK